MRLRARRLLAGVRPVLPYQGPQDRRLPAHLRVLHPHVALPHRPQACHYRLFQLGLLPRRSLRLKPGPQPLSLLRGRHEDYPKVESSREPVHVARRVPGMSDERSGNVEEVPCKRLQEFGQERPAVYGRRGPRPAHLLQPLADGVGTAEEDKAVEADAGQPPAQHVECCL